MTFKKILRQMTVATSVAALTTSAMPGALALTVRDDVTVEGSETLADNTQWDGVVQIYMQDNLFGGVFFNCSGSLINARTVITAAHCVNSDPSFDYGIDGQPLTPVIAYGPDTFDALFGWLDAGRPGTDFSLDDRNGLVLGNQVITHPDADPAFGSALNFPAADVAMISLSSPLANLPSYAMLFSPAPVGEHVSMVAYGGHGVGSTGDVGIDGKRQAGENIIGMIGSQNDFLSAVFGVDASQFFTDPGSNQSLYFIDFDNPNRTGDECGREGVDWNCSDAAFSFSFFGGGIPQNVDISLSNDWLPGDALPNEAGTAGGDSGSAIFFDQLGDQPLIGGVLSGGFTFTSPVPSGYADISYYNPLFNFYDFIVEANPYKYVSANAGDGNWSDASHWVQDLDPGYFVIDEAGNVVNGIPDAPEPGVAGTGPKSGTVLDVDIAPATSTESAAEGTEINVGSVNFAANGSVFSSGAATDLAGLASGRPADGLVTGSPDTAPVDIVEDPELVTYQYGDIGSPGPLAGPGSTDFVPNNGRNGNGFFNYFDVTLSNAGTTTVDMDVQVDALSIQNVDAVLNVGADYTFMSIIDTEVIGGTLDNNGTFISRDIVNFGGTLTGGGTYVADTVWNGGILAPEAGMTIFGDLVMTSAGLFGYTGEALTVNGDVSLDGMVGYGTQYAFGDTGTLINFTGASTGGFGDTDLAGVLFATHSVADGEVNFEIDAVAFSELLSGVTDENILGLAGALTASRDGSFEAMSDIFGVIDYLEEPELSLALGSLNPSDLFDAQTISVSGFEQIGRQLNQRFGAIKSGTANGISFNGYGSNGIQVASNDAMGAFAMSAEAAAEDQSETNTETGYGAFVELSLMDGETSNSASGSDGDLEGVAITVGGDVQATEELRLGAFFNFSDVETNHVSGGAGSESEAFTAGVYGVYDLGKDTKIEAYVGAGQGSLETVRVGGFTGDRLTGSTDTSMTVAGLGVSRKIPTGKSVAIEPSAGLEYIDYAIDAFTETGGSSAMAFDRQEITSTRGRLGAKVHFNQNGDAAGFQPSIGVNYVHDFDASDANLVGQFASGASTSFTTTGAEPDDSWFEAEAAIGYGVGSGAEMQAYIMQTIDRDDVEYTTLGAKIKINF